MRVINRKVISHLSSVDGDGDRAADALRESRREKRGAREMDMSTFNAVNVRREPAGRPSFAAR